MSVVCKVFVGGVILLVALDILIVFSLCKISGAYDEFEEKTLASNFNHKKMSV